ncbi:sensor domain-containing diguanylate cyclase [bacterium]|nr:sensor domain-containing diguanylate cyclase [bacterium]
MDEERQDVYEPGRSGLRFLAWLEFGAGVWFLLGGVYLLLRFGHNRGNENVLILGLACIVVGWLTRLYAALASAELEARGADDKARIHLMSHLGEVTETFTRTRDVEAVLSEAVRALVDHLGESVIALQLHEQRDGASVLTIEEGGERVELDEAIRAEIIELGRTVLIPDLAAEGRYPALAEMGYTALMAAPLGRGRRATDRAIGLVAALRRDVAFTAEEQDLLTWFSHYAGLIVESAQLYQRTEHMAQRDSLTELYNKRRFAEILEQKVEQARGAGRPVALIMLDVDDFKLYNDAHGHPAGDEALRQIARILLENIRADDIVARYGGEEFVIILPATGRSGARRVAETIRETVADAVFGGEAISGHITMSLGVAVFPDDAADPESLIQQADAALYRGKDAGRNRVRWAGEEE